MLLLQLGPLGGAATGEPAQEPAYGSRVLGSRSGHEDGAAPSSVIERGELAAAVNGLAEVLDQQPGLRTSSMGGLGSFSMLSIRGSTAEQVLVLLDGIPLNSAEGGPVDLSSVPLGPLERVTVYRGVAPLWAGSSAMGGVVDLRTRSLAAPRWEVEARGGSFASRAARAFGGAGAKGWGAGLSLDYQGSRGDFPYQDDRGTRFQQQDDRLATRANNRFDALSVLLKGRLALGEHSRLRLLNLFSWRERGVPGLALHPTEASSLEQSRNLLGLVFSRNRIAGRQARLELTPYLSWSRSHFRDPFSEIGMLADDSEQQSWAPGLRLWTSMALPLDEAGAWLLTPRLSAQQRFEQLDRLVPGVAQGEPSQRQRSQLGAELALQAPPLGLELVASLRYEHVRSKLVAMDRVSGAAIGGGEPLIHDEWTYRGALVWRPREDLSLRSNLSAHVRFPSLFELFGNTGVVQGNPVLRPERGLNGDLGLVFAPRQGKDFGVELYGFQSRSQDLIQFVRNAQSVTVATNVQSALLRGVEAGLFGDLLGHLRFRGSGTWLYTENQSELLAQAGKRLPHRPRLKGYARLEGYGKLPGWGSFGAHLEGEYMAGNFLDFANLVELPPRLLFGAGAYLHMDEGRWRLGVEARNLADEPVQDLAGYPLPGRYWMVTLRWSPSGEQESRGPG